MRLLYVEDHAVFARAVCTEFLAGHQVQVTPSLMGARAALAAERFDALLVDFDLEDGKGAELLAELRAAGATTPIVAVSATSDGNEALLRAGAQVAVPKASFSRLPAVLAQLTAPASAPPGSR